MTSGDRTSARRTAKDIALPVELVLRRILVIRGQKVMLDADLASLYEVETKALVQAVKRNVRRFPNDFMFQLSEEEFAVLRSQSVTANDDIPAQDGNLRSQSVTSSGWGGRRTSPYAFTEQGVAMLSSVLRSERAVAVNIAIMRAFVHLRRTLESHVELARKLGELEQHVGAHDAQIEQIIEVIRQLMEPPLSKSKRQVGVAARDERDES